MRIVLLLGLVSSLSMSASFCNKTDDSKKSSSDDKSSKDKKKKSADDDDDKSSGDESGDDRCKTGFADAAKNKDNDFKFKCPADCALDRAIYGTGWYTTDSPICIAAVHSGAIKVSKGGEVTVKAHKGLKAYLG